MPKVGKRPCNIRRRASCPDPRVGARRRACHQPECQMAWRRKTQASWRRRNPDYALAWRLDRRKAQAESPEPLRLPPPLPRLPWDVAKYVFGAQGADFLGVMGALMVRVKTRSGCIRLIQRDFPADFPWCRKRPAPACRQDPNPHDNLALIEPILSPTGAPLEAPARARPAAPAPAVGLAG